MNFKFDPKKLSVSSMYEISFSIYGSTIARLAQDKLARGEGAPDASDMRSYAEEAEAVVELWVESVMYGN